MKIYARLLDECIKCPNSERRGYLPLKCIAVNKDIPNCDEFIVPIPEWCPLPDYKPGEDQIV